MRPGTLLAMTRPGFLAITAVACLLGMAFAASCGCGFSAPLALSTLALALTAHAGANVLNDYHDALNGADDANHAGLFPFTGGSRLIQQGVTTAVQTRQVAMALLLLVVPGGVLLAAHSGGGLLAIGMAGLLLGWAYSAPPLALMSRGAGELAVAGAWWLVVIGADYVQRRGFFIVPAVTAVSFALLVANILLVNGFPDAAADGQVGKRTAVVILGPRVAAALYAGIALLAHAWLAAALWLLIAPTRAAAAFLSLPLSLAAAGVVWRHAAQPLKLRAAIVLTIAAAVVHGLAMAAGLVSVRLW